MSRIILTAVTLLGFGAVPRNEPAAPVAHPVTCRAVGLNDIGKLPLSLTVGTTHVEFTEWASRELGTNASVGFRITSSGPVTWVTESGSGRAFTGTSSDFLDELALVKPNAPTLSRITFCEK